MSWVVVLLRDRKTGIISRKTNIHHYSSPWESFDSNTFTRQRGVFKKISYRVFQQALEQGTEFLKVQTSGGLPLSRAQKSWVIHSRLEPIKRIFLLISSNLLCDLKRFARKVKDFHNIEIQPFLRSRFYALSVRTVSSHDHHHVLCNATLFTPTVNYFQ